MSRIAALLSLVVAGCSSGTTSTSPPTRPAIPPTTDAAPTPIALTRDECEVMVMHVVDLTVREEGSAAPDDRDKIRAELESFVVECVTLEPEIQRCTLAAMTLAEVSACQPPRSTGDAK